MMPVSKRFISPMSNSPLLVANNLCTYYGHSQALFDVSLSIPAVGGVAILGRNGHFRPISIGGGKRKLVPADSATLSKN